MENSKFVDNENIPLSIYYDKNCKGDLDNNYDDYKTPNTSKVDETTFTTPNPTDKPATSTLCLRQKVKQESKQTAKFLPIKALKDRFSGFSRH